MYYDSCIFDLVLRLPKTRDYGHGMRSLQADARKLTIPSQMRLFMSSVASDHMAYVRKLNIKLVPYHEKESSYLEGANTAVSIVIAEEGPDHIVVSRRLFDILKAHGRPRNRAGSMSVLSNGVAQSRADRVLLQIQRVVGGIVARDGKARLKLDDLYDMRAAMEAGL